MRRVEEMMTAAPIVTIGAAAAVSEAARLMAERRISHLVVVDEDLVGVLCACDIETAERAASVGCCMSRSPLTLESHSTAFAAARSMIEQRISCIPVVDGARVVGIVTLSDLRRAGVLERAPSRCAACGSDEHVRSTPHDHDVGFCLDCRRSSAPPRWDDDLGGG